MNNTNISTRIVFSFGLVIILVLLMGTFAYYQATKLWQTTDNLYNHPFAVSKSAYGILEKYTSLDEAYNKLILSEGELDTNEEVQLLASISVLKGEISTLFDDIYLRFLGDKQDINNAYTLMREYQIRHDDILEHVDGLSLELREQQLAEVNLYYKADIFKSVKTLIIFAKQTADSYYHNAKAKKQALFIVMIIVFSFIVLITSIILYFLVRGIRHPLKHLAIAAEKYRKGDFTYRIENVSSNEMGFLGATFNELAASVEEKLQHKQITSELYHILLNQQDIDRYNEELLKFLIENTEAKVAAVYQYSSEAKLFEPFDSIGVELETLSSFSAKKGEGEFGQVMREKKICHLESVNFDSALAFKTVYGTFAPKSILSIPILDKDEVVAVISLASLNYFSPRSCHLVDEIWHMLIAGYFGVRSFQKAKSFGESLDEQNQQLERTSTELIQQAEELKEFNVELQVQKKQLGDMNQLKSAFLSNMSHELRTPLNSIIALGGVLARKLEKRLSVKDLNYLDVIQRNGKHLLSLINEVLDLSRLEAGKVEIFKESFSLNMLIDSIIEALEPIASQKGLKIVNSLDEERITLYTDKAKCYHILQNIIFNAVKFTHEGSVDISVNISNQQCFIDIKDTGIGILEENIPFIFDEFRRVDEETSKQFEGSGLGLSIANKYCRMLGGSISVSSEIDKGSQFSVQIPFEESPDVTPLIRKFSEEIIPPPLGEGRTILIVEDDNDKLAQISDILEGLDYNIVSAKTNIEALEVIHEILPDAMVLDMMMDRGNGFEVLKEICNIKAVRELPVLVFSVKQATAEQSRYFKEHQTLFLVQKGDIKRNEISFAIANVIKERSKPKISPFRRSIGVPKDQKGRILIIEDNVDTIKNIHEHLAENHELFDAQDGIEGARMVAELVPDLILMDISLPGKDGIMLMKEIKKNEDLKHIPVVALTTRVLVKDRDELLDYGFDDYVAKPIDHTFLERTINNWFYEK